MLRKSTGLGTALAILLAALAGAPAARAEEPDFMALSAGAFSFDDPDTAGEFRAEYRSKLQWWIFRPFTGIMATTDAGVYGYGGLLVDVFFGTRWVLTPSFAIGGYVQGDGRDLGHLLEFRSQLELAYRFDDRSRLGLAVSHMSNGSIADHNPGVNSIVVTYAIPFSKLSGNLWD